MANYQAGFQAKIRVNSTAYAGATYQLSDECPEQDVSNTEGIPGNPLAAANIAIGNTAVIGGLKRFMATIRNATFDVLSNPFAAPFAIASSTYIALLVFLNGAAGVKWSAPSFYVNRSSSDGDVKGLQPVAFGGIGDGAYSVPSS